MMSLAPSTSAFKTASPIAASARQGRSVGRARVVLVRAEAEATPKGKCPMPALLFDQVSRGNARARRAQGFSAGGGGVDSLARSS